jgi:hypothetical protein
VHAQAVGLPNRLLTVFQRRWPPLSNILLTLYLKYFVDNMAAPSEASTVVIEAVEGGVPITR